MHSQPVLACLHDTLPCPLTHVQREAAELLGHVGVGEAGVLLHVLVHQALVRDLEGEGLLAEAQVLRGHKAGQEDVDALPAGVVRVMCW